ncbi:casein kinase substrate phosphoprotein PP28-domain-containing protein [Mycena maculata]|uniref:Casein kinase substrate phosphoprotein PP28-domain-containing protein n=1 Tax=Mycena maculata TaxID=230809 RepID=A0AAD7HXU9_9AGAR|nr:casein kinase substrate phosphoprotein PP28-domain-containing protein [Mycena maculata]
MVRGSGKFKQKRGGGRNFSKNLVLDENGTAVSTDKRWAPRGKDDEDDSDEEEEEEEESEEESEEEAPAAGGSADQPELSRTERKELKKKQAAAKQKAAQGSDDEDEDLINPNHVGKKMNISDLGAPKELSRREREQKEKQDAKDRYWKLHVAGKTDQAKADLGRLAKIRADREAAQAKRKAEAEAKAAEIEAKTASARR